MEHYLFILFLYLAIILIAARVLSEAAAHFGIPLAQVSNGGTSCRPTAWWA
jgi:hypothetical protein